MSLPGPRFIIERAGYWDRKSHPPNCFYSIKDLHTGECIFAPHEYQQNWRQQLNWANAKVRELNRKHDPLLR